MVEEELELEVVLLLEEELDEEELDELDELDELELELERLGLLLGGLALRLSCEDDEDDDENLR